MFYGSVNSVEINGLTLDVIAISKDGRVYAVMRNPPPALVHFLKILTPLIDAVGWMYGVRKAKGVPNGFGVVGAKIKRSVVVTFDSGMFALKKRQTSLYFIKTEGPILLMNFLTFLSSIVVRN